MLAGLGGSIDIVARQHRAGLYVPQLATRVNPPLCTSLAMQTSTPNASVLVDPLLTPMSQPKQVQHCHVPSNEPTFIFTENKVVGVLSCILCMATDTLPFAEEALLSNKCKEDKYWKPCSVPCSASATSPLLRNMPFRTSIESSCNVAGNGPTHVRRTTVTTYAGIGLLHPHCKYCDSRIQIRTRFPLFCDCGTGRKQDKSAPNVDHFESKAC